MASKGGLAALAEALAEALGDALGEPLLPLKPAIGDPLLALGDLGGLPPELPAPAAMPIADRVLDKSDMGDGPSAELAASSSTPPSRSFLIRSVAAS